MLVVPKVRRRVIEVGRDGVVVFIDLDGHEIKLTLLEKSGRKARLLIEAPEQVKIDHAG
jgi:sRNA-binding carbon storage regulator CsrA